MARLQLNKSSLAREASKLTTYRRFLPSLDLKRQQLMASVALARRELADSEHELAKLAQYVRDDLPMLATEDIDLHGLVKVKDYHVEPENFVGVKLPRLAGVTIETRAYSPLTKPHWVDDVVRLLKHYLELRLNAEVKRQRVTLLEKAVNTITQRVNLFEKVLIPRAERNIKAIKIYLNEETMAAIVRSKIAKNKRAAL